MYKITVEYIVNGMLVQEILERVTGISKEDACDSAYLRIKNQNPTATAIEVLCIEEITKVA